MEVHGMVYRGSLGCWDVGWINSLQRRRVVSSSTVLSVTHLRQGSVYEARYVLRSFRMFTGLCMEAPVLPVIMTADMACNRVHPVRVVTSRENEWQ